MRRRQPWVVPVVAAVAALLAPVCAPAPAWAQGEPAMAPPQENAQAPATPASPAPAPPPPPAARPARAEDFSWLAGTWKGELEGGTIEEVWAPPTPGEKGAMLGMSRWYRGDTVLAYELRSLEPATDPGATGLVLKLRHFGQGLIAWEEARTPLTFQLIYSTPGQATFESRDPAQPARRLYRREGADGLVAVEERTMQARTTRSEVRYTRVR